MTNDPAGDTSSHNGICVGAIHVIAPASLVGLVDYRNRQGSRPERPHGTPAIGPCRLTSLQAQQVPIKDRYVP